MLRWFDHWLKGIDTGILREPPVKLFVMGENVWRDEQEWPLARVQDVEVTGPISVTLWAASSAPDTDFTAKLVDVTPSGDARNLTDGIIRARYRESAATPTLIEPGKVYAYTIDLWATSNGFKPGHCMRLEISSPNFPRFDRNPNTGHPFAHDAELRPATQMILHNAEHPSHIVLPIIPR